MSACPPGRYDKLLEGEREKEREREREREREERERERDKGGCDLEGCGPTHSCIQEMINDSKSWALY